MKQTSTVGKSNKTVMVLLILGLSTIIFPLYMTVVIAFKQPSEMTNSISGILSLPKVWSLQNFREAMEVTDFWNSLKNSLLISGLTVGLSILIHSLMGYTLGRNKSSKFYNFVYLFIVSGMFVPFAILMMPLAKQTAEMGLANWFGVILLYVVFYMRRGFDVEDLLEDHFPDHAPDACDGCGYHGAGSVERCNDAINHHGGFFREHASPCSVEFPVTIWNKL